VGKACSITEIKVPGGLCDPDSYLAAAREIGEALVAADLLDRELLQTIDWQRSSSAWLD
jgi:hypothetical protein